MVGFPVLSPFCSSIQRSFTRKYELPPDCEPESVISAVSQDGVLTITAPKRVGWGMEILDWAQGQSSNCNRNFRKTSRTLTAKFSAYAWWKLLLMVFNWRYKLQRGYYTNVWVKFFLPKRESLNWFSCLNIPQNALLINLLNSWRRRADLFITIHLS